MSFIDKSNNLQQYISKAEEAYDCGKFDFAINLFEQCIKIDTTNKPIYEEKILLIKKVKKFSDCVCDNNEFCTRYQTHTNGELINRSWCQSASEEDRKRLFSIKKPQYNMFLTHQADIQKIDLLYNRCIYTSPTCILAKMHQIKKDEQIRTLCEKYKNCDIDVSKIQILSLGHSNKQFSSIKNRTYLTKINLNEIDAGEYSGNEWAESRVYMSKNNLFSSDVDFVGLTSASWNLKFTDNLIDNFHNWESAKILLNSPIDAKIVLCAHCHCSCLWTSPNSFLTTIYGSDYLNITKSFMKLVGFKQKKHIYVPYANQLIAHKSIIDDYIKYLNDKEIFRKIAWFVSRNSSDKFIPEFKKTKYHNVRLNGYFMEMVTCYWFNNADYLYIPNHTSGLHAWYAQPSIQSRSRSWL